MEINKKKPKRSKKETGRWTKEQHSKFILGLVNYGKNWKKVEELVGTRSGAQVRSHAQKFFNRLSRQKQSFFDQSQYDQSQITSSICPSGSKIEQQNPLLKPVQQVHAYQDDTFSQSSQRQQQNENNQKRDSIKNPNVSPRLIQLIKQQSEDGTKSIPCKKFANVLHLQTNKIQSNQEPLDSNQQNKNNSQQCVSNAILNMEIQRIQLRNLGYLLTAYIVLHGDQLKLEQQSFFQKLIKYQRKYICSNLFFELIDIPNPNTLIQNKTQESSKPRKKSFTLYEPSDDFKQQLQKVTKVPKLQTPQETIIQQSNNQQKQKQAKVVNISKQQQQLKSE